jgi:phenylalanyl-tRNA synthetase beta chain
MLKAIGIEQAVFFAELDLRPLTSSKLSPTYASLPRFPRVRRDVAFVVDTDVDSERVEQAIRAASSGLLQSVEVFDVYHGEGLAEGKKSLAYTLDLMSTERTLTDPEIEAEVAMIVQRVEKEAGAVLRAE